MRPPFAGTVAVFFYWARPVRPGGLFQRKKIDIVNPSVWLRWDMGLLVNCVGPRAPQARVVVGLLASVLAWGTPGTALARAPQTHYDTGSVAAVVPPKIQRASSASGIEVVKHWRDAGVSPANLMGLVEVLILTQSPVLSANPQTVQNAKELSAYTADMFAIDNNEQAEIFLKEKSLQRLEHEGWLAPGTTFVNSRRATTVSEVVEMWERYSQFTDSGPIAPIFASEDERPENFAYAVKDLKQAVMESGLNSLTVPLPMWSSSDHLRQVARHVRQANRELQSVTQWSGPVLGLKQRVNLTVTWGRDLAFTNRANNGEIDIQSAFSSLAHEWEHALEFALASDIGAVTPKGPALISTVSSTHPFVQHWENLASQIDTTMAPTWYPKLQALSEKSPHNAPYYARRHERIAYTFEGYVQDLLPPNATLKYLPEVDRSEGIGPTAAQARPTAQLWRDTFSLLSNQWWNTNWQMNTAPFKNKLNARRGAHPLNETPKLF